MDLMAFINNGTRRYTGEILARPTSKQRAQERHAKQVAAAIAATRKQWMYALQVDETAAWMSTYEQRPDVLQGLTTVLSLAALAKRFDDGHDDSPEVRIVRGALSAVEQCGKAGATLDPATNRALSSAARVATQLVNEASDAGIEHACTYLSSFVKQLGS